MSKPITKEYLKTTLQDFDRDILSKEYINENNIPLATAEKVGGIKPDNITLSIDANGILSAQKAIDSIEIGGTNLFSYNSSTISLNNISTNKTVLDDKKCFSCISGDLSRDSYAVIFLDDIHTLSTNQEYTLTLAIKANKENAELNGRLYLWGSGNPFQLIPFENPITTDWQEFHITFTIPTNRNTKVGLVVRGGITTDDIIYYDIIKLEKGNKPTTWSPAPEDLITKDNIATYDTIGLVQPDVSTLSISAAGKLSVKTQEVKTQIHTGTWVTGTTTSPPKFTSISGSRGGDYYINTDSLRIYFATDANYWVYRGTLGNGLDALLADGYEELGFEIVKPTNDVLLYAYKNPSSYVNETNAAYDAYLYYYDQQIGRLERTIANDSAFSDSLVSGVWFNKIAKCTPSQAESWKTLFYVAQEVTTVSVTSGSSTKKVIEGTNAALEGGFIRSAYRIFCKKVN